MKFSAVFAAFILATTASAAIDKFYCNRMTGAGCKRSLGLTHKAREWIRAGKVGTVNIARDAEVINVQVKE